MKGSNSRGRGSRRGAGVAPAAAGVLRRIAVLVVTIAFTVVFIAPARAVPSAPGSELIAVAATLRSTGRLFVAERRTITVTDGVDGIVWRHPVPRGQRLEILGVSGPQSLLRHAVADVPRGAYAVKQLPGEVIVYLNVRPADESWVYTVRYRVDGAAGRWADVGDLLWTFVAPLEKACTGPVTLRLSLPVDVPAKAVRVFGPDRPAVVGAGGGTAFVRLPALGAGRWLGVGVVLPVAALAAAPTHAGTRLPAVAAQQRSWQAEQSRLRSARLLRVAALVAAAAAVVILFAALYVYRGLGYRLRFRDERAASVPAELPPAVVSYLWNGGQLDDNAVVATVLDLCNRELVRYSQADDGEGTLTLEPAATSMMPRHDAVFIQSVFKRADVGRPLTLEEFRLGASRRAVWLSDGLVDWTVAVEEAAAADGFLVRSDWTAQVVASVAALALVGVSVYAALTLGLFALLPVPIAVAIFLLSMSVFRHPSRDAVELYRRYKGLRNTLADMDTMGERPAASVVLWREYLVLATVFGLTPRVLEQMRLDVPEAFAEPTFAGGYW